MIVATSRRGGSWFSLALIFACARGETAWFGGSVYTEKNPGECPVSRLTATMRTQRSAALSVPACSSSTQVLSQRARSDAACPGDRRRAGPRAPRRRRRSPLHAERARCRRAPAAPAAARRARGSSGFTSHPCGTRPMSAASSSVVPRPMKGSYTTSPGAVSRSMKKRGNCGLKHARYEISCRLCAARCRAVQNSLVSVLTRSGSPASVRRSTSRTTVGDAPGPANSRRDASNDEPRG